MIKKISGEILDDFSFVPVFYDIARTGRKLWVSIYFRVTTDTVSVRDIQAADNRLNEKNFTKHSRCVL